MFFFKNALEKKNFKFNSKFFLGFFCGGVAA